MIEAQNEINRCLTAEAEGYGIGFMAITQDVNVDLLNECYELAPFHGLSKPNENDILQPKEEESEESQPPEGISIKHKLSDAGLLEA